MLDLQGDYYGLELHDGAGRRPQLSTLLVWAFFSDWLTVVAAKHVRLDSKIELSENPLDCGCCRKEVYCDSVVSVSEYN